MAVHRTTITFETQGELQAIDLTERVTNAIRASGLREGIACVFTPGSTCAIVTNEFEPGLFESDLRDALARIAPASATFAHDRAGGDANGRSHVRSAILGASATFPFAKGTPLLGTWQQVVFLELDVRPRKRDVIVQLVGE